MVDFENIFVVSLRMVDNPPRHGGTMTLLEWTTSTTGYMGTDYTVHRLSIERGGVDSKRRFWVEHNQFHDTDWDCTCYFPKWRSDDDCLDMGTVGSRSSQVGGQRFVGKGSLRRRWFCNETSQYGGLDI